MAVKPCKIKGFTLLVGITHYKTNCAELPFITILLPFFDPKTTIYYHCLPLRRKNTPKTTMKARKYGLFLQLCPTQKPLKKYAFCYVSFFCIKPYFLGLDTQMDTQMDTQNQAFTRVYSDTKSQKRGLKYGFLNAKEVQKTSLYSYNNCYNSLKNSLLRIK